MKVDYKKKSQSFLFHDILKSLRDEYEDRELINYLKKNHVPLLWIPGTAGKASLTKDSGKLLTVEYQNQLGEYHDTRNNFQEFNRVLRDCDIDYILIKSVGIPPSFPWESDNIDIFFLDRDVPRVKEILPKLNYFELKQIREKNKTLFRKFDSGKSVSAIHVHSNVGWESVPFVDLQELWKNRRRATDDPQITIPGPEDAFLITVAHSQYENKKIRLADFVRLAFLSKSHDLNWDYIFKLAKKRGWSDGITRHLQVVNCYSNQIFDRDLVSLNYKSMNHLESDFKFELTNFPYKFKFRENVKLWYGKIKRDEYTSLAEKKHQTYYSSTRTLKRKILRYKRIQPSYYIGIAGVDGSGKTLQAELLDKALTISEVYTNYVWIRGAVVKSIELINKMVKKGASENHSGENGQTGRGDKNTRKKILNNNILSFFYKSIIFAETFFKFNFKIWRGRIRRKVIISDRTIFDAIVDLGIKFDDHQIFDSVFAKLLILLTPTPDHLFLLQADRELVLKRKQDEISEEMLKQKLELYKHLGNKYAFNVIDTHLSINEVHQKLLTSFYQDFFTKYQNKFYKLINPS